MPLSYAQTQFIHTVVKQSMRKASNEDGMGWGAGAAALGAGIGAGGAGALEDALARRGRPPATEDELSYLMRLAQKSGNAGVDYTAERSLLPDRSVGGRLAETLQGREMQRSMAQGVKGPLAFAARHRLGLRGAAGVGLGAAGYGLSRLGGQD